jgi:hypothetical protein
VDENLLGVTPLQMSQVFSPTKKELPAGAAHENERNNYSAE